MERDSLQVKKYKERIIHHINVSIELMTMSISYSIRSLLLRIVALLLLVIVSADAAEITDTCREETQPLLQDTNLQIAQSVIFEDYTASFNDKCDVGLDNVGCSIKFEGDERTYNALCSGSNGQIYKRPVVLKCGFGVYEYDLGYIPTCVGSSCNVTNVGPSDVETEQVDKFLSNLTLTGCKADSSSSYNNKEWTSIIQLAFGGAVAAVIMIAV